MQVCVWLDNQMALTTVKACPNNTQMWLPVRLLCESAVPFPFLLPPFDSVFFLSSHYPPFSPVCVVFVIVFTMITSEIPHRFFFYVSCSSVCSTGHRKSIWSGGKPSFFLSSYFSHYLINSTLSTTRALVPKKAWTWMPSSLPFYIQAAFIFDRPLNLSQSGCFAV